MLPLYTDVDFQRATGTTLLPLRCLHCKSVFYLRKGRIQRNANPNQTQSTGSFCSVICGNDHRNTPLHTVCAECSKPIRKRPSQAKRTSRDFCGARCSALYNNAHRRHGTRVSKLEVWLHGQLPALYPNIEFHFNRKDAIQSELDIFMPALRLAVELNGIFHYEAIYGPEKLETIQNNDKRKFQACLERGIELCLIDVSQMKNFKVARAQRFLTIICDVIDSKLGGPMRS